MASRNVKIDVTMWQAETHRELCAALVDNGVIPVDSADEAMESVPEATRYAQVTTYLEAPESGDVVGTVVYMDQALNVLDSFTV